MPASTVQAVFVLKTIRPARYRGPGNCRCAIGHADWLDRWRRRLHVWDAASDNGKIRARNVEENIIGGLHFDARGRGVDVWQHDILSAAIGNIGSENNWEREAAVGGKENVHVGRIDWRSGCACDVPGDSLKTGPVYSRVWGGDSKGTRAGINRDLHVRAADTPATRAIVTGRDAEIHGAICHRQQFSEGQCVIDDVA